MLRRSLFTSAGALQGKVYPKLQNVSELVGFLNKSNENVHDLVPGPTSVVDSKIVRKMLRLSGLESDISAETEQKWIQALNTQIGFINHLQPSGSHADTSENMNGAIFRLISSDHQPSEALGLEQLMEQVRANQLQSSGEKIKDFDQFVSSSVDM
ncbi:hypothetical protein METBIDRAFT_38133 [Metschnikowia bicuspidata var. bicuspidata NRRL YB-4993]|uniref:Glutamyl-tRNA(Gln) amidotransferase subunit F, mitochondrial n=1 Tax=Metschnikowia bicuspidata var. bicuspidata NRRL YB-4993 TaxID=869754 RepID=A0A1A0HI02_9ASCO|nr:hypothetical protein METBIDRAFT_38133 [Metschnikowia bicuspidata var. bicuspidata NRRL YB-4993]OBA23631.1 hypothetical protein METBIDRAFT_38133 [Metschnikowia bicuspidata var. bicuspidata NRRL YB-4993]